MTERTWNFAASPSRVFDYVEDLVGALPPLRRTDAVRLALTEALANAIIHGALGLGSRDEMGMHAFLSSLIAADRAAPEASVAVRLALCDSWARIVIEDPGKGFDVAGMVARPGRGLDLIRRGVSRANYECGGRRLVLWLEGS